jgi:hypothetical protein
MRTITELPEPALAKLTQIEMLRGNADDAQRGVHTRLASLPQSASADKMRALLLLERDKHAERFRCLSSTLARLNQWRVELRLPPGSHLEFRPQDELPPGEPALVALATVRHQIDETKEQISRVRHAPLPRAAREGAVREFLGRLSRQAGPKVNFDASGAVRLHWADTIVSSKEDVLGLLAYVMDPEYLLAAFLAHLPQEDDPSALPPLERTRQIAQLETGLLALERREEGLIELATRDGVEVFRRPDASPLAVLGLHVVQQQAKAAAA